MLQKEFYETCKLLLHLCDIYEIDKGYEDVFEIVQDGDRRELHDFERIADRGFPHQDTARHYASLIAFYLAKDLRTAVLYGGIPNCVRILQEILKKISMLL